MEVKTSVFVYRIKLIEIDKFEYGGYIYIQDDLIGTIECQYFGDWFVQLRFNGLNNEFMQTELKIFEKALYKQLKNLH